VLSAMLKIIVTPKMHSRQSGQDGKRRFSEERAGGIYRGEQQRKKKDFDESLLREGGEDERGSEGA